MKAKIHISDNSNLLGKLAELENKSKEALAETIRAVARGTVEQAQSNMTVGGVSAPGQAPRRQTEELAQSIRSVTRKTTRGARGRVGTSLVKGYFLEFGTADMAARPWLLPAFEEVSFEASVILKDQFEAAL